MSPQSPHIIHVAPVGYARAEHADPDDGSSVPNTKPEKKSSNPNWWLEVAALLICISTISSVVVLLHFAHDQPLANYDTSLIPFNAIVSVLSTVTRVSLAYSLGSSLGQWKWNWFMKRSDSLAIFESFEDASRGPWGSLTLMAKFKVRHWATLGAFFTVIILGLESSLQCIITYEGFVRESPLDASRFRPPILSGSGKIDVGAYKASRMVPLRLPSGETFTITTFFSHPDLALSAAMHNGFSQRFATTQQTASFFCATGNCTWPVFTSLSICSRCNDVTSHLRKEILEGSNKGTIDHGSSVLVTGTFVAYSLPYLNISNYNSSDYVEYKVENKSPGIFTTAHMTSRAISNPGRTLTFTKLNTMISAVGIIKVNDAFRAGKSNWTDSPVAATECALFLCARAYNSSVHGGRLEETIIASWASRVPGSFQGLSEVNTGFEEFENIRNNTLVAFESGEGEEFWGDTRRSDLQLQIPEDEAKAHDIPADAKLIFNLTQNTVGSLGRFINFNFFQPTETMIWPIVGYKDYGQAPAVQSLWDSSDLSVTFSNVALSLSNWMRDSSDLEYNTGNTLEYNTYIQVQWAYLPIPVAVVAAGCLFVLFSIWETRRLQLPVWKSSIISTLTHSLDFESRAKLRQADMDGVLKGTAKDTVVFLDKASDGLELKVHVE